MAGVFDFQYFSRYYSVIMMRTRIAAGVTLLMLIGIGYFVYASASPDRPLGHFPFQLGLDLQGGTQLTYQADTANVPQNEISDRMRSLKGVVQRRITSAEVAGALGVTDPIVQVETSGFDADAAHRLIVELPGVTDIQTATNMIGETPTLDFRLAEPDAPADIEGRSATTTAAFFVTTGLTGRFIEGAHVQFGSGPGVASHETVVVVDFDDEGSELFADITRENVGRRLGIFLDGDLLSAPVIQEEIDGGSAQISGDFTPEEARGLVRDLNFGALPMPIELVSTQSIGPSLGHDVLDAGVVAGISGLILVALFMILWYRVPGVLGVLALGGYIAIMLALFKLIGVTLTASGIAGFILSIGMAVDANIIIFERIKEELRGGNDLPAAVRSGFARAWPPIRDANITSMLTAIVLFYAFGQTFVRGFAVTFFLGVLVSMLTAIAVTRMFLLALSHTEASERVKAVFGSGIRKY